MNYIIRCMLLDKQKILAGLSGADSSKLIELACFETLPSTNRWLIDKAKHQDVHNHVCVADVQTAGVGRNGKNWQSGRSGNILMSMAHVFHMPMTKLSALSLVTGIAIVDTLQAHGISQLSLKWPNDVYLNSAKLAGILVQTQRLSSNRHCAVVGIGINVCLSEQDKKVIDQPVAELSQVGLGMEHRELIIARVIDALLAAFKKFNEQGLDGFYARWNQIDYLKDQPVTLIQPDKQIHGRYLGINRDGAACIGLPNHRIKEYYVGDISIRKSVAG